MRNDIERGIEEPIQWQTAVASNSLAFAIFHILFFHIPINFQVCEMPKCIGINVGQSIVSDIE